MLATSRLQGCMPHCASQWFERGRSRYPSAPAIAHATAAAPWPQWAPSAASTAQHGHDQRPDLHERSPPRHPGNTAHGPRRPASPPEASAHRPVQRPPQTGSAPAPGATAHEASERSDGRLQAAKVFWVRGELHDLGETVKSSFSEDQQLSEGPVAWKLKSRQILSGSASGDHGPPVTSNDPIFKHSHSPVLQRLPVLILTLATPWSNASNPWPRRPCAKA